MTRLSLAALVAGLAAGAVQMAYLNQIRPFQADLGIQVAIPLMILWLGLTIAAFATSGWRAKWALLPAPVAMAAPALLGLMAVVCSATGSSCI